MQLRIKHFFAQSQHKMSATCKQEEGSASTLAEPPLSLPVPCGLMPRLRTCPRPSCPMVQLIICSSARKRTLADASLCLRDGGASRPEPQRAGPDRLAWHRAPWLRFEDDRSPRNVSWYPSTPSPCFSKCPGPAVGLLAAWTETPQTHTNTDITA